jgi:hypothetical protein
MSATDTETASKAVGDLRSLIRREQMANVRESYGEWAHECFTWVDLNDFKRHGRAAQVADRLRKTREIARIVAALVQVSAQESKRMLETCRRPLRPTWAELGRISKEGQTDAGQQAETMIANAVVEMVNGLLAPVPRPGRQAGTEPR